ncbi:ABC transporter ATP-binding protein [Lewinella sp. 4G2]|uniref:ABC transporter ATP-binding protein n=1 Tax=Lewinella sp. 4G2 TaxID=1803372 RepID=UPI0007B47A2A|nr:ABC transporter ATP-binding protein [Lewinella sp. 4G2]OAV45684.1 ABC transporter ATP-binding protein [Lewinella sp. 4G2]
MNLSQPTGGLEAINLRKSYGSTVALDDLNFSVSGGEVYCLLGQNGAGKTTTINIFLGLLGATSGQALVNGESVAGAGVVPRAIAYIPEVVQLYGNLSGTENLDFFSQLAGQKHSREKLRQYLFDVGLPESAVGRPLSTYSKGMRQKVGIAIALSKQASFILMDEPTSGLDPKATEEFTELCRALAAEGTGIFMATHDIFNAVNIGSRVGIMRAGRIVHESNTTDVTPQELQQLYLKTI